MLLLLSLCLLLLLLLLPSLTSLTGSASHQHVKNSRHTLNAPLRSPTQSLLLGLCSRRSRSLRPLCFLPSSTPLRYIAVSTPHTLCSVCICLWFVFFSVFLLFFFFSNYREQAQKTTTRTATTKLRSRWRTQKVEMKWKKGVTPCRPLHQYLCQCICICVCEYRTSVATLLPLLPLLPLLLPPSLPLSVCYCFWHLLNDRLLKNSIYPIAAVRSERFTKSKLDAQPFAGFVRDTH